MSATVQVAFAREEMRFDPVHGPIERQAACSPDAVAALCGEQSLRYAELNARANRLARHLRALGVREEVCVGVLMERSLDLPVALLAVLKAGGAFVPLDPSYPADRLAFMLADTAAPVVLTQSWLRERLPANSHDVECVCVDTAWDALSQWAASDLDIEIAQEQLAYVIYTSGSTGSPKGVELLHRGLASHAAWLREAVAIVPDDRILQCNSISFDATLVEFFAPLQSGAALVLAHPSRQLDMPYLAALIAGRQVSLVNCVPSFLRGLLGEPSLVPASLRYVACGGDALTADLARRLREIAPGARLGNFYGPTETTIDATHYEVPAELAGDAAVSIGRPIDHVWCEVLDAQQRQVPPGVVGELHVGGAGVARGYRNQPRLTAERFIEHPSRPGARMFRTGDRVRQRADGNFDFIGRTDSQVKVRGYRIELGEVESALAAIDGVEDCAVVLREDARGEPRLVAYASGADLKADALRVALRLRLPGHMLPSAFVLLAQLPMLASGKIDRARLPAPSRASLAQQAFDAPRGELEQEVAGLWRSLLGLEQVGRDDHFFELGGHSLLLVAMLHRLRQHGWTVDAHMVFAHPTLAGLCVAMTATRPPAAAALPASHVPEDAVVITPEMFPLLDLDAQELARIAAEVPGGAGNIQNIYPLLPLQEGMLFHHRLQQQGDAYLSRRLLGFDSSARAQRFLAALQQVIDRHDAFRTAILWRGLSRPVQVVLRRAQLPVLKLRGRRDGRARLLACTDPLMQRMALDQAPLFSAVMVNDATGEGCTLALLSHHIINDNVSEDVLWDEVAAILAGAPESLSTPVPSFRTFVGQTLSRDQAGAKAYFERELGDLCEPTTPFGLVDVRNDGHQATESRIRLDPAMCARLSASARAAGVSAAVLFHVAWAMVLARCDGRDDVVFGTVLSGRLATGDETNGCVGLLMNTLPLRVRLTQGSVRRTVAAVHAQLAELLEHEHASLVLARSCSAVPAPSPLFNALLNYRHGDAGHFQSGSGAARDPRLSGITLLSDEERTNYPISLTVDQCGDGFLLTAQCIAGADPARIAAYASTAIAALVSALEAGGDDDIATLDVLPGEEYRRLVVDGNATARPLGQDGRVVDQLAARMAHRPDAPALRYGDECLSYRELCAQVHRAAHRLRARGVARGSRVGVCLPRGTGMVVTLLAILRAGAAYVPLDPEYPWSRLAYMAGDAGLDLMVGAAERWQAILPPERGLDLADLIAESDDGADIEWSADPQRDARAQDPAYVIYTSGSTGTPKGVVVPHRALENFLASMASAPGLSASDRLMAVTTLSFDIAALELLLPLCVGAEVVIASREIASDGVALRALLESSQATVMQATPATWRMLIEAGWEGDARFKILVGGEALADDLSLALLARSAETWNLYGPTETTVWSTCWQVRPERAMSIGGPIANTSIHVLDAHLRPCPLDVAGEIYIGGAGLSLGYHDRPELTAQRFVDDPFDSRAGARLYRTGDRGRWCADGLLEHLGRLDFQVKLRGHRIEPGEIEARLLSHPQVAHAVVVVRKDAADDPRLVAYVVPAADAPDANALRAHLRAALPEYMLPSHIQFLSSLPLAPNGKLDRAALPAPEAARTGSGFEPPRGEIEQTIAAIWQALIGVERVGRHDNFFELGGHSLLAMRAVARIEAATGARITMLQLATGSLHVLAKQVAANARPPTKGALSGLWEHGWRRLRTALSRIGRAAWGADRS
ncbi:non-ribosomal peptide synthetase [Lysobacter sp. cf310]|uniref:non-ribosomal peptide synthetase n=1 Tax=Lysobacter sp. cf310 TaxID=1761790 RepID=UPI0008EEA325|nr:non-ribosomal peptide synthetase [Lysobacter sp. cf310]SFK54714.1 amino acid adenylation domain-containing protein [Lysobacter sp. cf310]